MNECITVSEFLLQVLVYLATLFFVLANDISKEKSPFDHKKRAWRFKVDYWPFRWDNMVKAFVGGTLGALLAKSVGVPLIEMIGLPNIAEDASNLTAIMASTIYMPRLLSNFFKKK